MKFVILIFLVVSGLTTGFAQPVQDLKFWTDRVAHVHAGMRREDVERILPPYIPSGGGYGATSTISGGAQGVTYDIAPGYTVIVFYDYTGVPRDVTGKALQYQSPDNRLLAPVKLRPTGVSELRQVMLAELDAALTAKDAALITAARMEIESIIPRANVERASRALRDAKFQLMLAALQKVDAADDKSFDPNDLPMVNIGPPRGRDGRTYDSGISPDSIKDPVVREEYKRMLAANAAKAARNAPRAALYGARMDWIRSVAGFCRDQYDGEVDDRDTINRLVAAELKSAALKKEFSELLVARK